jgi:hypothetical protein
MSLQVKRCCDKIPNELQYEVRKDGTIDLAFDDSHYDYDDIHYCMYCGNRLQLERTPDTPPPEPYKPDLSSLSAKDRALEELKEEMQK